MLLDLIGRSGRGEPAHEEFCREQLAGVSVGDFAAAGVGADDLAVKRVRNESSTRTRSDGSGKEGESKTRPVFLLETGFDSFSIQSQKQRPSRQFS